MRNIYKICVITLALAVASCHRITTFIEGDVVASVGDKKLTLQEVEGIFSPELTPHDSLILLESYIDMWVKKQLKVMEAEKVFSESSADIDEMVEDYRNSLLTYKLDQLYIDRNVDTLVTGDQIGQYYADHRSDFVLDRDIVKGMVVKLPNAYRQKTALKDLMAGTGDKQQDFRDMVVKNEFELDEFTSWTDFAEFLSVLPTNKLRSYDDILAAKGVAEMVDGADLYYALVTENRRVGETAPLDRVEEVIKRVILNQRRQDLLRSFEDSLYTAAMEERVVDIRID